MKRHTTIKFQIKRLLLVFLTFIFLLDPIALSCTPAKAVDYPEQDDSLEYGVSDWVLASSVPSDAEIIDSKWTYTRTTYETSWNESLSGYTLDSSEWVKDDSGSTEYASFPSGFSTTHSIYKNLNKSNPYSASETATRKRTVSTTRSGYIYWHWAYNAAYYKNTNRWISDRNQNAGSSRGLPDYAYCYFYAFKSTTNAPRLTDFTYTWTANGKYDSSAVTYNCANCLPSGADTSSKSGLNNPRFLRFDYYTATYTDFVKRFHYHKTENLESATEINASSSSSTVISDVKKYVKYKTSFTITYDANGGSEAPAAQTKLHGTPLTLSTLEPVRDGYVFLGWSTNKNATEKTYSAGEQYTANRAITLYAVWALPQGQCGNDAYWTFYQSSGELIITGSGSMTDYPSADALPWEKYTAGIRKIIVSDGITSIGSYAFCGCSNAGYVQFPTEMVSIGSHAFENCESLTSINIPWGIAEIADYTFSGCSSLQHASFSDKAQVSVSGSGEALPKLLALGDYAFFGCSSLQSAPIPESVSELGSHVFDGCSHLGEVSVPEGMTSIGESAFANCEGLAIVTFPDGDYGIGSGAFDGDVLVTIRCYSNSPAHQYALDNQIPFELISRDQVSVPKLSVQCNYSRFYVSMSSEDSADIYYTLDGSIPTRESERYSSPVEITDTVTVKAFSVMTEHDDSSVVSYTAVPKRVSAPKADIPSGTKLAVSATVRFSCDTEGAEIWYATNGEPDEGNEYRQLYLGPVALRNLGAELGSSLTVYVMTYKGGLAPSDDERFTYSFTVDDSVPTITYRDLDYGVNQAVAKARIDSKDPILSAELVWYEASNSAKKYSVVFRPDQPEVSETMRGLEPATEYCYYFRAKNYVDWSVGSIRSFTTPEFGEIIYRPTLDKDYYRLHVGQSYSPQLKTMQSSNCLPSWESDNESVATVDPRSGKISAVAPGIAHITVTLYNPYVPQMLTSAICTVEVFSLTEWTDWDFSENHMIMHTSIKDQDNGFDIDQTGSTPGGNALMATAYLARWSGPVEEENDPLVIHDTIRGLNVNDLSYNSDIPADYHVQSVIWLPNRKNALDNAQIKAAINKYGAVYTSFYENTAYYNKCNYYYPESSYPTGSGSHGDYHAVAIVGWDDNYMQSNFGNKPKGRGAFLCKNSRGTNDAHTEQGFFWVSYYDTSFAYGKNNDYNAVFLNLQNNDNYNKNYQYDFLGPTKMYQTGESKISFANVFPENGQTLKQAETLKAVSFYNYKPETEYTIYVIPDYQGPESFSNLGKDVAAGHISYTGYDTVELKDGILLEAGTRFAVVVCLKDDRYVFLEAQEDNYSSKATAGPDESYIREGDGMWKDVHLDLFPNANVCLKAFTQAGDQSSSLFGTIVSAQRAKGETPYADEETAATLFQTTASENGALSPIVVPDLVTASNAADGAELDSSFELRGTEDCVTGIRNQGAIPGCWSFAAYASLESTTRRKGLMDTSSNMSHSAGGASIIILNHSQLVMAVGDGIQLLATVYPYEAEEPIYWESNSSGVTVSSYGFVTATEIGGPVVITAKTADGTVCATCNVIVKAPVPVESIEIENVLQCLQTGSAILMRYTAAPGNADKSAIHWTSSDPAVAMIDENGYLRAVGYGYVTITVTDENSNVSDSCRMFIDNGQIFTIDIAENSLYVSAGKVHGDLSLRLICASEEAQATQFILAFYTVEGQFLTSEVRSCSIAPGEHVLRFEDLSVQVPEGAQIKAKAMMLDPNGFFPLSPSVEVDVYE